MAGRRDRQPAVGHVHAGRRAVLPTVATPLLAPLRELHQRVGVYEDADRCNCPDRDIHEIGYSEDGDELCLNSPCPDEGFHCAECYDEFGEAMPYPCETVRLLDAIEAEVTA